MRRRSVLELSLGGLALALGAGCVRAAEHQDLALRRLSLSHPDPRFGGFSSLHLSENGRDCLLMTDRGLFVALRLSRDAEGRLSGAEVLSLTPMLGLRAEPLRPRNHDSEGMAVGPGGQIYVSFEGSGGGRIWRYAAPGAQAEAMPFSRSFATLPHNGGLEALALDAQGRLVAMPEDPPGATLPLYRLEAEGWRELGRLEKEGGFKPVSLDLGPDGGLYLLERQFSFPLFRSRLSRLDLSPAPRRVSLWQSRAGEFGNLEGLSVTHATSGRLRATMVADNNQVALLRNELIEIELP